jgi:hypothetical protein
LITLKLEPLADRNGVPFHWVTGTLTMGLANRIERMN